jgi:hypothetical protein
MVEDEMTERTVPGMPGIDMDDVLRLLTEEAQARGVGERDQRICMCGHPMSRHKEARGERRCAPSRMICGCRDATAAIEVSDTRKFLRKTTGIGRAHALVKGIVGLVEANGKFEWLVPVVCTRCGGEDAVPVGLVMGADGSVQVATAVPRATRLLCMKCVGEL